MPDLLQLLITTVQDKTIYGVAMLIVGQLSFLAAAWSFAKKDILELRRLQILSGVLGIAFNGYLAFGQDSISWDLATVVFWLSIFLTINVLAAARLSKARMEVALPTDQKTLFAQALPLASTRDIHELMSAAQTVELDDGHELIARHAQTSELYLIQEGQLMESLPNGERWLLGRGMMLGDLSYLIHDGYKGSEGTITIEGKAKILCWQYTKLKTLCDNSETLSKALSDGIARGITKKRNFLEGTHAFGGLLEQLEPRLSARHRDLHAETFPDLSANEFNLMLTLAKEVSLEAGQTIDVGDQLACIESGKLSLSAKDQKDVTLNSFDLLGEFGLVAPDRKDRLDRAIQALEPCSLLLWSRDTLDDVAMNAPKVYIHLMKSISRSLVIKLTERTVI
jgi:CRP-like cAMP-binding protein